MGTIAVILALALFLGYIRSQRGKEYSPSSKEGKRQMAIVALLVITMLAAGTYSALSSSLSKGQQYILLFIVFGGTIAVLIGAGIAALRNKLTQKHKKQDS